MDGYSALWLPGYDHAGIATQIKVEEKLRGEGKTRFDLGRERLPRRGLGLEEQVRRPHRRAAQDPRLAPATGSASASRWTTPAPRAVRETFVDLYEKGLIYKGKRIINWCPHVHHRPLRRRGRVRRKAGPPLAHALPALRRLRRPHHRHDPSRDHARRHRRRRQPERRALHGHRRQDLHPAPRGPRDTHRRGRLRRDGLRHRLRQDDALPRPERL